MAYVRYVQIGAKQTARLLLYGVKRALLRGPGAYKITATPISSLGFHTTIETFQMWYCMMFYLKGHQNCQKLKIWTGAIYLIKEDFFRTFNFDYWQF